MMHFDVKFIVLDSPSFPCSLTLCDSLVPACFDYSVPPPPAFASGPVAGVAVVVDSTFWELPHTAGADDRKRN
jgi:hypothetical protein